MQYPFQFLHPTTSLFLERSAAFPTFEHAFDYGAQHQFPVSRNHKVLIVAGVKRHYMRYAHRFAVHQYLLEAEHSVVGIDFQRLRRLLS